MWSPEQMSSWAAAYGATEEGEATALLATTGHRDEVTPSSSLQGPIATEEGRKEEPALHGSSISSLEPSPVRADSAGNSETKQLMITIAQMQEQIDYLTRIHNEEVDLEEAVPPEGLGGWLQRVKQSMLQDVDPPTDHDCKTLYKYMEQNIDSMDIYDIAAITSSGFATSRACLCVFIQGVVIPAVCFRLISGGGKGFCDQSGDFLEKAVGASLCMFSDALAFKAFYEISSPNNKVQLYAARWQEATFVNGWSVVGIMVNVLSIIISGCGAVVIMYHADTPVEIVLQLLAIQFVTELDDLVVTDFDRDLVKYTLSMVPETDRTISDVREKFWWATAAGVIAWSLFTIGVAVLIPAPVYFAWCY